MSNREISIGNVKFVKVTEGQITCDECEQLSYLSEDYTPFCRLFDEGLGFSKDSDSDVYITLRCDQCFGQEARKRLHYASYKERIDFLEMLREKHDEAKNIEKSRCNGSLTSNVEDK